MAAIDYFKKIGAVANYWLILKEHSENEMSSYLQVPTIRDGDAVSQA